VVSTVNRDVFAQFSTLSFFYCHIEGGWTLNLYLI
jgi:hypothetical protein